MTKFTKFSKIIQAYRKKIHIRLDDDLHQQLRVYVAERGTTIQNFITDLLREALKRPVA